MQQRKLHLKLDFMLRFVQLCLVLTHSANLTMINNDAMGLIMRYLPNDERFTLFRYINTKCNEMHCAFHKPVMNALELLKSLLWRTAKRMEMGFTVSEDSVRFKFIGIIHEKFRLHECFALASPVLLERWGRVLVSPDSASSTDTITKVASVLCSHIGRKDPNSTAWESLDAMTKALIQVSRQLVLPWIFSAIDPTEMHCLSLLYSFLWDRIVSRNHTMLPPLETVYDLSENQISRKVAELKYLTFLMDECGLFLMHPHHLLNTEWFEVDIRKYVRCLLDITERYVFIIWFEKNMNYFDAIWILKILKSASTTEWKQFLESNSSESKVLKNELFPTLTSYLYSNANPYSEQIWLDLLMQLMAKNSLDILEPVQYALAVANPAHGERFIHFFGKYYEIYEMTLGIEGCGQQLARGAHLYFIGNSSEAARVMRNVTRLQLNGSTPAD